MKIAKYLVKALVVALALFVAPGAAFSQSGDTFERILRDKKIKFGYIVSPPGAIRDPASGAVSGFYIDAARALVELMQVEAEFVETSWANFVSALQAGQFDISIAATFATIPRAMAVSFTNPINYQSFSGVARRGDQRFKKMADLNKAEVKVAVVQGSAGHEFARQNLKLANIIALGTSNLQQPFLEVSAGRADVAIQDESQVRRYVPTHKEVVPLFEGTAFNTLPLAWAVRRGDQALLGFLNTSITYRMTSGRWDEIAAKYGPTGRYKDAPQLVPFGAF